MKRAISIAILAASVGLLGGARCLAEGELTMEELEVDHALTFDFPTPHTPWARPYAGGRIRVLFFTDGRGTHPRECVELIERFDIEGAAVFWARIVDTSRSHWHGGETGLHRMLKLLEQEWDCFVFMEMDPRVLEPEPQYKLLKAVTEGAGLVLVGANDARVLKEKNRIEDLPPLLADGAAGDAYAVRNGRGVRLPRRPVIPYHEGWQVEDDYWHERLGRAVLWAAGREPSMRIDMAVSQPEFERTANGQKLTLTFSGKPGR